MTRQTQTQNQIDSVVGCPPPKMNNERRPR